MSRDLETCGENVECISAGIIRVPEKERKRSGQKKYLKKNHRQSLHKYGEAQQVQTKKPRGINTWKHNSQSSEIQPQLEKSWKQPEEKWLILYKET